MTPNTPTKHMTAEQRANLSMEIPCLTNNQIDMWIAAYEAMIPETAAAASERVAALHYAATVIFMLRREAAHRGMPVPEAAEDYRSTLPLQVWPGRLAPEPLRALVADDPTAPDWIALVPPNFAAMSLPWLHGDGFTRCDLPTGEAVYFGYQGRPLEF